MKFTNSDIIAREDLSLIDFCREISAMKVIQMFPSGMGKNKCCYVNYESASNFTDLLQYLEANSAVIAHLHLLPLISSYRHVEIFRYLRLAIYYIIEELKSTAELAKSSNIDKVLGSKRSHSEPSQVDIHKSSKYLKRLVELLAKRKMLDRLMADLSRALQLYL